MRKGSRTRETHPRPLALGETALAVPDLNILGRAQNTAKLGGKLATPVAEPTTLQLLVEEENLLHQGGTQLLNPLSRHLNWVGSLPPMPSALSTPLQQLQLESLVLITTLSLTLPQNTGG